MRTFLFPGLARAQRPQCSMAQSFPSGRRSCPPRRRTVSPVEIHSHIFQDEHCVFACTSGPVSRRQKSIWYVWYMYMGVYACDREFWACENLSIFFDEFLEKTTTSCVRTRTLPCPSLLKRLLNMIDRSLRPALSLPSYTCGSWSRYRSGYMRVCTQ